MNQRFIPVFSVLAIAYFAASAVTAFAQVPPNRQEIAAYGGLFAAAVAGDAASAVKLIAARANVNERDAYSRTPLHVATFAKQREIITLLVKAGADINAQEHDRYDAVTIAAVADDVETLRLLLKLGANAKAITSRYDGTALIAAAHLGHDEVVKVLIAAGAPLDHVNNLGWTALIESIVLGNGGPRHTETLRALVQAGANVNLPDRNRVTPLQLARGHDYAEMVRILEKAGAK
jgi:ankyrin repeat protein